MAVEHSEGSLYPGSHEVSFTLGTPAHIPGDVPSHLRSLLLSSFHAVIEYKDGGDHVSSGQHREVVFDSLANDVLQVLEGLMNGMLKCVLDPTKVTEGDVLALDPRMEGFGPDIHTSSDMIGLGQQDPDLQRIRGSGGFVEPEIGSHVSVALQVLHSKNHPAFMNPSSVQTFEGERLECMLQILRDAVVSILNSFVKEQEELGELPTSVPGNDARTVAQPSQYDAADVSLCDQMLEDWSNCVKDDNPIALMDLCKKWGFGENVTLVEKGDGSSKDTYYRFPANDSQGEGASHLLTPENVKIMLGIVTLLHFIDVVTFSGVFDSTVAMIS